MNVQDLMSKNPACCSSNETIQQAARLMVEYDCGEIPIVDPQGCLVGVITDRDICCRIVAEGINPIDLKVAEYMSSPVVSIRIGGSAEDCRGLMEQNMIRRIPVVDDEGHCIGIVSQADLAKKSDSYSVSHLLKEVSAPSTQAANPD